MILHFDPNRPKPQVPPEASASMDPDAKAKEQAAVQKVLAATIHGLEIIAVHDPQLLWVLQQQVDDLCRDCVGPKGGA